MTTKQQTALRDTTCYRCGKRHLSEWVYLELDSVSNRWHKPGDVLADRSQGLFRFGAACARRMLRNER
jgi:hypothetical protein